MFSLIFSFFFFFQRVSAGFDRFSVRVNAVSHGNRAISVIFSDEFLFLTAFIGSKTWLLAHNRDPTLFLHGFLCRWFHGEKRDHGKEWPIESRKDGCEAITSASTPRTSREQPEKRVASACVAH